MSYLIRLDDACETHNQANWVRIIELLSTYNIKAIIGVIPFNQDQNQKIDLVNPKFGVM